MTVVNPKSISGINSITTGSGSDNLLTIHTSDASSTERVRINSSGDVIVGSGITVSPDGDIFATGVTTSTTFVGALTGNVTGTLQTAAQANITSLGTLTGLAVNGNITLSDSIIHLDDTNTKIQFPSNDTISFHTNASEKLRIDSDGRLLSGATSSSSSVRGVFRGFAGDGGAGQGIIHLEVNKTTTNCGNGENLGSIRFGSNEGHIGALIGAQAESAWSSSSDLPSYINFYTCPDGSNTLTERLRIDSSGRVGINCTPQEILHVKAASEAINTRDGVIFGSTDSLAADKGLPLVWAANIGTDADYGVASICGRKENSTSDNGAGYLQFGTGTGPGAIEERMRIDSDGKLLHGCTSTNGGTSEGNLTIEFPGNTRNAIKTRDTDNSGTVIHMVFVSGSSAVGTISGTTGQAFYNNLSDYRSKENDVKITDGIEKIKLLRPIRFNYKVDKDTLCDGFFAHEVTPAVPTAVTGEKDAVDSEGKFSPQMLDTGKIIPLLTAALQEEIAKREALETRVAALEAA